MEVAECCRRQDKIDIYREMVLMRKFEEKAQEMYEARKIGGFLHLYIGQEAVASGFMWPLEPQDYVIGAYREHGQALARCAEPKRVMAELFGKRDGVSGGKGGSMHLFDKSRTSSAARRSSAAGCRSRRGSGSRSTTATRTPSACASSATARSTRARSTKP